MTDYIKDDADNVDEYSTRDQPVTKSFHDRYGFDERDGPPEDEEVLGQELRTQNAQSLEINNLRCEAVPRRIL